MIVTWARNQHYGATRMFDLIPGGPGLELESRRPLPEDIASIYLSRNWSPQAEKSHSGWYRNGEHPIRCRSETVSGNVQGGKSTTCRSLRNDARRAD